MKKYNKIVIGIDQSYKNCGIGVFGDKEKIKLTNINLLKFTNNTDRRIRLRTALIKIAEKVKPLTHETICIIERIRLNSHGFINIDYIKSIGALNALIVDTLSLYEIPVYSVDTRCWKATVIGTCKPAKGKFGVPSEKWPTVEWAINSGFESDILKTVEGKATKGTFSIWDSGNKIGFGNAGKIGTIKYKYDDDMADAAAISMFGFINTDQTKLQLEH